MEFTLNEKGVWYTPSVGIDGKEPSPIWICSRLKVTAVTRDHDNRNHGRLLCFFDSDGKEHKWAMPMELLASDGIELRKVLMSEGLLISNKREARSLLISYIQSSEVNEKIRSLDRLGWYEGAYVLPDETIGNDSQEKIVFQVPYQFSNPYETLGTLQDWQQHISCFCPDNSRLAFAVSVAFAAPLLPLIGEEGGGFHFRGKSSGGKTTTLRVASSVYGGKKMLYTWRATANALEAIAAMHNNSLLCLDELGQSDPKDAGDAAYLLANGAGKSRANKASMAKERRLWNLLFLSTGEVKLSDHIRQSGRVIRAGQEIRIVDIPSEAGPYGIFQNLYSFDSGSDFSRYLALSAERFHGIAGRVFIRKLTENPSLVKDRIRYYIERFIQEYMPPKADGQVLRVLHKISLVAAAGAYATELGITEWPEEEAFWAAATCFESWIKSRGGTSAQESQEAVKQLRYFIEMHAESRFSTWNEDSNSRIINRAGFKRMEKDDIHYFIFPEVFKTNIFTTDSENAIKILMEKEILIPDADGKSTRAENLPGFGKSIRCYRINGEKLFLEDC